MRYLPRGADGGAGLVLKRLGVAVAVGLAAAALSLVGLVVVRRLGAAAPRPILSLELPVQAVLASGSAPPVVLPPRGSLAVVADGGGVLAVHDADAVRPIASVAKAMTALVVLQAHPLAPGEEGPSLTLSDADVAVYRSQLAAGGSVVAVRAGERLSERQALLALLLPSANNLAVTLGRWVSGDDAAFVARLNAEAAHLGMSHTHFADASGFDPATVSTASDLVLLGRAVLGVPALADIVATRQATLPDGTVLRNLDTLLDTEPGWLGIKTGDSAAAGGCLLFAVRRPPPDAPPPAPSVTLVGAVLGQSDRAAALDAARAAVSSALAGYRAVDVRRWRPPVRGRLTAAWGDTVAVAVGPGDVGGREVLVTVRLGDAAPLAVAGAVEVPAPLAAEQPVGAAVVARVEGRRVRWPVVAAAPLPGPPWWWRLLHG